MNEECQADGHRGGSSQGLESANPGSKPLSATCSVSLFLYFLGPQFTYLKNEGSGVHGVIV